ncbi:MAG: copper-binding protein [Phycisphaerales bacterium]|nr:copper-binding protein [Phycisphaerales bacterium]
MTLNFIRVGVTAFALAMSVVPACSKESPATAASNVPVETYSSRGKVVALPDPKGALLQIHHEEIPTFKAKDGRVIGMKQMIMPFPLTSGVSLGELKPGDAVEFTFTVDWSRTPPQEITIIKRLEDASTLQISEERQ